MTKPQRSALCRWLNPNDASRRLKDHRRGLLLTVGGTGLLAAVLLQVPAAWWSAMAPRWSMLLLVGSSVAALAAGAGTGRQRRQKRGQHEPSAAPVSPDRPLRSLPSWMIAVGAVVIVAVTTGAAWWFQQWLPGMSQDVAQQPALRAEGIRTGLTIGAAITAGFALLLAFRRQQLAERTQKATEYDAGEKRVTELYVKAVDQLGSDKAPVRLGGLNALERLAQDNRAHRQSVVEVICAYLRMPYASPDDKPSSDPDTDSSLPADEGCATGPESQSGPPADTSTSDKPALDPREERQVRLTAQRILAKHLRPETPEGTPNFAYWGPETALDLTEAVLVDLDFTDCHLHNATFTGARFIGTAGFGEVTFTGTAALGGAEFTGIAWFGGAAFTGEAWFGGAKFHDIAWFGGAAFTGRSGVGFRKATFNGNAGFGGATFTGIAGFDEARFHGTVGFSEARFDKEARFSGVRFTGDVWFDETVFTGDARLSGAVFGSDAWFDGAAFIGEARFVETRFGSDARFDVATFDDEARFSQATFTGEAGFDWATFAKTVWFDKVTFAGGAGFALTRFGASRIFEGATVDGVRYDGPVADPSGTGG